MTNLLKLIALCLITIIIYPIAWLTARLLRYGP